MRTVYETNVFGPVRVLRAFIPLLEKSAAPVVHRAVIRGHVCPENGLLAVCPAVPACDRTCPRSCTRLVPRPVVCFRNKQRSGPGPDHCCQRPADPDGAGRLGCTKRERPRSFPVFTTSSDRNPMT